MAYPRLQLVRISPKLRSMFAKKRRTELALAAVVICSGAILAISATLLMGGFDDAFITYTFAQSMSEGWGITYYENGPPVYGSTTVTWLAILAVAGFAGLPIPPTSMALGALFWALCYALIYWMFRERLGRWPTFAVLVLGAVSLRAVDMSAGMEAGFYASLTLLCFGIYAKDRLWIALLLSAILVATRLDGGLVPLMIGANYLLSSGSYRPAALWDRALSLLKAGTPAIVGLAGLFIFTKLYFGSVVPNTFLAKTTLYENLGQSFRPSLYFNHLSPWFSGPLSPPSPLAGAPFATALAVVVIFFCGVGIVRAALEWPSRLSLPLLWLPVYVLTFWAVGLAPSPWYYAPTIPLIYVAFVYGAVGDLGSLRSRESLLNTPGALAVLVLVGTVYSAMLLGAAADNYSRLTKDPLGANTPQQTRHAELAAAVDRQMERRSESSADVVTFEVGRMGFETEARVHDILGLVSPEIVEREIENSMHLVNRYNPEYVVVNRNRSYPLSAPILRSDKFSSIYEPVYTFEQQGRRSDFIVYHRSGI